jgi:hypothetical protein
MFKPKKPVEAGFSPKMVDRLKSIAARPAPLIYVDVGGKTQRASRQAVFRQAIATLDSGEILQVVIRNLSSTGCRIEFFSHTPLRGTILIDEASLPLRFRGEVLWQAEGSAGLRIVENPAK